MAVGALDRSVLVRDAGVVAGRRHIIVAHEALVALRQILLGFAVEIAERRRQTVAAMFEWNPAERPQGILQAIGQRRETLAAKHDMGMRKAREGGAEVIKTMLQENASDHHAEHLRVGEVGQAETARWVLLPEHDILLRSGQRPPRPHATLQRAPDARADLGMATPDLRKDGNGAQAWGRLQDRHDLGVPYVGQRIGPPSSARGLLLRGQARISLDPVAGRWRETRLGGGDGDSGGVGWSGTHVQPHLMVGDVEAGQMLIPRSLRRISSLAPSHATARRDLQTRRRG